MVFGLFAWSTVEVSTFRTKNTSGPNFWPNVTIRNSCARAHYVWARDCLLCYPKPRESKVARKIRLSRGSGNEATPKLASFPDPLLERLLRATFDPPNVTSSKVTHQRGRAWGRSYSEMGWSKRRNGKCGNEK